MARLTGLARRHWFYVLLPFLLLAALGFRTTHPWGEQPGFGEATALFDWCLFVPLLYALCYRDLPRRALFLRTMAMACGGLWIAGRIVPDSAERLLRDWGWLRGVGLAVLAGFEAMALVAVFRVMVGAAPDARELERQGIPPVVAKLMLAEARFWRWVWTRLGG